MSDVVSFTEIDGQQVDLLPARTLLQSSGGSGPDGAAAPLGPLLGGVTGGGDDSNASGGGLGGGLLGSVTGGLGGLTGGA
ncbi:MAG: hypothetical protein ACRDTG_09755 [Pseudonocardiaceae bacterium]